MKRALAGRASVPFDVPDGITFVDIDAETGKLADARLPEDRSREAFIAGTEPHELCELHTGRRAERSWPSALLDPV